MIKKKVTFFVFLILLFLILGLAYFSFRSGEKEINGFSMDAPYNIKIKNLSGENEKKIKETLNKSDSVFNAYEKSFLYTLNSEKRLKKTNENAMLFEAVGKSLEYCDGFFDISVRPYTKLWDFSGENSKVPSEEELKNAKDAVGYENIIYSENEIILKNNTEIELGAIAKGYICDKVYDIAEGCEGIFDIGGTVKSSYEKPVSVGVRNPDGGVFCSFYINKGESVSTSGSYERCFYLNGRLYHHILDPKTGICPENNLLSVTVISDSALKSDILSTKFFVSGTENARIPDDVTVIFIDQNKKITQMGKTRELKEY